MYKISNIISMPIISIYESEYFGIVYNVMIDCKYKKIKYICILNENDNIPRIVSVDDIYKIGNDCIFIKNKECVSLQINYEHELQKYSNPINLIAYDLEGKYLGIVNDANIDNKNKIEEFIINSKNYKITDILNIGNSALLVNNKKFDIRKFKPKQSIKIPDNTQKVLMQNIPNTLQENINHTEQSNYKLITDFRFLTGRKLTKDILAINGEVIAKTGTTITKELINKASFYGKLVELARYSTK